MGRDSGGRCWRRSQGRSGTGLWGNGELPDCTRNPPAHVDSRMWWPLAGDGRGQLCPTLFANLRPLTLGGPLSTRGKQSLCLSRICISADTKLNSSHVIPASSTFNINTRRRRKTAPTRYQKKNPNFRDHKFTNNPKDTPFPIPEPEQTPSRHSYHTQPASTQPEP